MRWWARIALVGLLVGACAHAQDLPPDADGDGIVDEVDACPGTATYALVDAEGCDVCACDVDATGEPWAKRGDYLHCVLDEVHARRLAEQLDRKASRLVIKAARNSTCGYETRVRCCIMLPSKPAGMCKVMDVLRCDANALHAGMVEDHDAGSCFPNPCVSE
jgi:hypothetical protein